jgi:hypothetical protein
MKRRKREKIMKDWRRRRRIGRETEDESVRAGYKLLNSAV